MCFPTIRAYLQLIYFEFHLAHGDFGALHEKVRSSSKGKGTPCPGDVEKLCAAMELACIWYWKEALCLQRSAATTCLLKRYGIPAEMVIGAQQMPFKAHAWVEVDGRVVNDKSYVAEKYAVLDRC